MLEELPAAGQLDEELKREFLGDLHRVQTCRWLQEPNEFLGGDTPIKRILMWEYDDVRNALRNRLKH